ncbi:hypothetical protein ACTFIW_003897 [Dictyostelium discoideum]
MEGIKNLPSMVKQGYYMVKLDIKKAYLHVDLFRFVYKGSHYRWKTMPFGLSTAPRILTMLLRPLLRILRDINVSVITYLDDLSIVGSAKEECLSNLKKTMDLLYTYTALLKKTLVLCKMFGLARSSDLVMWSFNGLIITPDSIKGPIINAKEQRKGVLSILELTSLDDINSQVCPVRHLSTYLRASKGRIKPHSGDSVFIQNEGKPLDVKEINISYYQLSQAQVLILAKDGRWKSNDTVDTSYGKRIIGEKSDGFLNTFVQNS